MRRRGLSLLEVIVAAGILLVLILSIAYTFVPAQRIASATNNGLDLDRDARRLLSELRRDLRTSGYKEDGTDQVTLPAPSASGDTLTFRMRLGPADTNDTSSPAPELGWSTEITYGATPDGIFAGVPGSIARYRVTRAQSGQVLEKLRDVSELSFTRLGDNGIRVRLELLRPDPNWTTGSPPPPIRRVYEEHVELLNVAR